MFSQIAHDEKNNVYCWYDYKGVPSRWVEVMGRHTRKFEGFEETVLKLLNKGYLMLFPILKRKRKRGLLKGIIYTIYIRLVWVVIYSAKRVAI